MPDNTLKIYAVVDAKGAKAGVAETEAQLSHLQKTAETSTGGIEGKVSTAFSKAFGKGSIASSSLSSLGTGIDSLAKGALAGALPVAVAGAGAAVGKFILDSTGKFAALGKEVETFSTVAGTSADQASRFIAVADDYGVSAESIQTAVGKLGKTLGGNIGALDSYGVAVGRAKDGSVDLAATTFNVIDAYNRTTDPAKKAALGAAAFGKSYQDLIPLIDVGSAQIKASFDSVDKAQLFDEKKVQEAKNYGVAIDNLKDQFYDFQLTVGEKSAPTLTAFANGLARTSGPVADLIGFLGTAAREFSQDWSLLGEGVQLFDSLGSHIKTASANVDDATAKALLHDRALRQQQASATEATNSQEQLARAAADAGAAFDTAAGFTEKSAGRVAEAMRTEAENTALAIAQAKNQLSAYEDIAKTKQALTTATDDYVKSLQGEITNAQDAADANIASQHAQENLTDATQKTIDAKKEHGVKSAEYKKAVEDERDALISASKAQKEAADKQDAASGIANSATDSVDRYNSVLLENAKNATPAARKAAYDYIIQVNQIPPEKATEIQTLVDQGKLDEANAEIAATSRTRQASVEVTANTTKAESDIQALIRTRNMVINAQIIAAGGAGYQQGVVRDIHGNVVTQRATGGRLAAGEWSLVGEKGPELFRSDHAGTIVANNQVPWGNLSTPMYVNPDYAKQIADDIAAYQASGAGAAVKGPYWTYGGMVGPDAATLQPFAGWNTSYGARGNYHITVNVAPGADPAAVGRATVEAIRAYERVSGPGWRN